MKKVKWLIIKSNHIKETTRNVLFSSDTIILALSRNLNPIPSNDMSLVNGGKRGDGGHSGDGDDGVKCHGYRNE